MPPPVTLISSSGIKPFHAIKSNVVIGFSRRALPLQPLSSSPWLFVSAACGAVHLLPRVRPLNMRPQLADGCRQRRLCSEPSDTTSSALTNYGKWREWLLLAAAVTAIKGPGPPTQMADSRHIHACFFPFFLSLFFCLSAHVTVAASKVRWDVQRIAVVMQQLPALTGRPGRLE